MRPGQVLEAPTGQEARMRLSDVAGVYDKVSDFDLLVEISGQVVPVPVWVRLRTGVSDRLLEPADWTMEDEWDHFRSGLRDRRRGLGILLSDSGPEQRLRGRFDEISPHVFAEYCSCHPGSSCELFMLVDFSDVSDPRSVIGSRFAVAQGHFQRTIH